MLTSVAALLCLTSLGVAVPSNVAGSKTRLFHGLPRSLNLSEISEVVVPPMTGSESLGSYLAALGTSDADDGEDDGSTLTLGSGSTSNVHSGIIDDPIDPGAASVSTSKRQSSTFLGQFQEPGADVLVIPGTDGVPFNVTVSQCITESTFIGLYLFSNGSFLNATLGDMIADLEEITSAVSPSFAGIRLQNHTLANVQQMLNTGNAALDASVCPTTDLSTGTVEQGHTELRKLLATFDDESKGQKLARQLSIGVVAGSIVAGVYFAAEQVNVTTTLPQWANAGVSVFVTYEALQISQWLITKHRVKVATAILINIAAAVSNWLLSLAGQGPVNFGSGAGSASQSCIEPLDVEKGLFSLNDGIGMTNNPVYGHLQSLDQVAVNIASCD